MKRNRPPSKTTLRLLEVMLKQADSHHYGYELMKMTGISSGTLYPILIRLEERGLLDAQWQSSQKQGRPPRHAYKLTHSGRQFAISQLNDLQKPALSTFKAARI